MSFLTIRESINIDCYERTLHPLTPRTFDTYASPIRLSVSWQVHSVIHIWPLSQSIVAPQLVIFVTYYTTVITTVRFLHRLWDVKNHKLLRRRDVIWGQLEPFAPPLNVSIKNWDDVSNKENKNVIIISLSRNLNPYFEDVLEASQSFIKEISENKNLQDLEVDSITELSSAKTI